MRFRRFTSRSSGVLGVSLRRFESAGVSGYDYSSTKVYAYTDSLNVYVFIGSMLMIYFFCPY